MLYRQRAVVRQIQRGNIHCDRSGGRKKMRNRVIHSGRREIDTSLFHFGQGSISRKHLVSIGLVGALSCAMAFAPVQSRAADDTSNGSPSKIMLASLQDAFSNVADELEPAVVTVVSTKSLRAEKEGDGTDQPHGIFPLGRAPKRSTGTGSGVIVRKDGWILTNDHVVGGADRVTVKMHDGREFVGAVRRDYRSDLAMIKIESPTPLPTARLGDSDKIKIGHWAIAIGSPYRYEGSFSVGVVSSLFRQHRIRDTETRGGERLYPSMIQTDAAINPGNSGGPLVNLNGEVIGINTAIESEGGGSIGIGFAIPINSAKFVMEQLLTKGKVSYGLLGVNPKDVTPQQGAAFGVNEGAWVDEEPLDDSPAGKAGIHAGDVITAVNGKPIHNELDLRTIISRTTPDTTVDITFLRDRKLKTVKATLTVASTPETDLIRPREATKPRLGIEVQPITDKLAASAGLASNVTGVVIKSVDANGPIADIDELTEGSVLLRVNDTNTTNVQAFKAAIEGLKSGDQVRLLFQNRDGKHFRVVQID
jgi:serine protease Do